MIQEYLLKMLLSSSTNVDRIVTDEQMKKEKKKKLNFKGKNIRVLPVIHKNCMCLYDHDNRTICNGVQKYVPQNMNKFTCFITRHLMTDK